MGEDVPPLRCYMWGQEIDKIEALHETLNHDDWFKEFLEWTKHDSTWEYVYLVVADDSADPRIEAVWVGSIPQELIERFGTRVRKIHRSDCGKLMP